MQIKTVEHLWRDVREIRHGFNEYVQCIEAVHSLFKNLLMAPKGTPEEFLVSGGDVPTSYFKLRKNLFSSLFQAMYHLLQISRKRRLLYGKLNHLFRICVTSADNLLDNEDKVVVPIIMPGESRVMRQVVSIMAADRVMIEILQQAVNKSIITPEESHILFSKTLSVLLPSAAEEASEEGGIQTRPTPDYVLNTIHRLKTGLLFHLPFLGPENIEKEIDESLLARCKEGLLSFGLGCQLLDDIRDMAKDYLERRHNYVLSMIAYEFTDAAMRRLEELANKIDISSRIFFEFPEVVTPTAESARALLENGVLILHECGLTVNKFLAKKIVKTMFSVLGVKELVK